MSSRSFTIEPRGAFSLRESALFGFGQRVRPAGVGSRDPEWDGVMRLAFCVDGGYEQHVGVEVRQTGGTVQCLAHGPGELSAIEAQVARVLSLDHDARSYDEVGARDPVIGRLQQAAVGLRPPLFYSPYEAATWAVLSARRPGWQMAGVRDELSRVHGTEFELAGERLVALPTPKQLLGVQQFPGIEPQRLERLHGVARAAQSGLLEVAALQAMGPDASLQAVQQVKGIGPFYASLIVIRATGFTDVLATEEPRVCEMVRRLYEFDVAPDRAAMERIAEPWRPWRTWVTVLIRAAGPRVLDAEAPDPVPGSVQRTTSNAARSMVPSSKRMRLAASPSGM